jgi:wyosine [tRNA(Phe)-imidazoG37] synthetase (radical SAM superfamily)
VKTIFGPVLSRRFGTSLGIDLSPTKKQCNFDCLYCELAPSTPVEQQESIVAVETIINELKQHLNSDIDVITITANGEPTLYPHLDTLIDELDKIKNDTQTLILTNSSNLTKDSVFNSLLKLDQVKLSLDSVSKDIFKKIDRPLKEINIDEVVQKVIAFSEVYKGKLFIEILFVKGINDTEEEVKKLNETLLKLRNITRVDIGTIDRPPAYDVKPLSFKELYDISHLFSSSLPIHIASRGAPSQKHTSSYSDEDILNTLDKRALTMDDIDLLFDEDSKKRFMHLISSSKITTKKVGNLEFFIPSKNEKRKRAK